MLARYSASATGGPHVYAVAIRDTVPEQRASWIKRNIKYIKNKHLRDSLMNRMMGMDAPPPTDDSSMIKSEQAFFQESGKIIRHITFKKLQVFGPRNINDTGFHSSLKILELANRLHYDSREWVIRQSLFFREKDTVNAYELAENERYLRNRPFIGDARIIVVNGPYGPDSVDILVVTKDVFEYSGEVTQISQSAFKGKIVNQDLFGAGQALKVGWFWNNGHTPPWNTQVEYTKYNVAGSFADVSAGYSTLNNFTTIDSANWEGSYYLNINRPLYRTTSTLVGGIFLASNRSININAFSDSMFRDYKYRVVDVWAGYNFRNSHGSNGDVSNKPDLAISFRHYNTFFNQQPKQPSFQRDPFYSNRRYVIGQFNIFKQQFFKTHNFFGFGRTEDIPLGYNIGLSGGTDTWVGRSRIYAGVNAQKYWVTPLKGLFSTTFGIGNFWQGKTGEDGVVHIAIDYYSQLFNFDWGKLRQFFSFDYLDCFNPKFYKPLNINLSGATGEGIYGFKDTRMNGFQRINLRSVTNFYSPLRVYGFKFNFAATYQAAMVNNDHTDIFHNTFYSGIGMSCTIRNENLSLNTIQIAANYFPIVPPGVKSPLYFEITTISDLRFDITLLRAPSFLRFL